MTAADRAAESRAAQKLPPKIGDAAALAKVAALIQEPARRKAAS